MSSLKHQLEQIQLDSARLRKEHQKETQRLNNKIGELEERARDHARDKTNLQAELMAVQKECRQVVQRETALRSALEKADANAKGGVDKSLKYVALQKKVEDLEKIHEDGKRRHHDEMEAIRRDLDHARRLAKDQDEEVLTRKLRESELEEAVASLRRNLSQNQEEIETLQRKLRAADEAKSELEETKRKLVASEASSTYERAKAERLESSLKDEQTRHAATKTKLKDLQEALTTSVDQVARLEDKKSEIRTATVTLAKEYDSQLAQAKSALKDLATLYGDLASTSVPKTRYEEQRLEALRLRLLTEKLKGKLTNKAAQVDELVHMVRAGQESQAALKLGLREAEQDLENVLRQASEARKQHAENRRAALQQVGEPELPLAQFDEITPLQANVSLNEQLLDLYGSRAKDLGRLCSDMTRSLESSAANIITLLQRVARTEATCEAFKSDATTAQAAYQTNLELLHERDAELSASREEIAGVRAELERVQEELREDVLKAENALAEELERAKEMEKVVMHCRMGEDGLKADIEGLMEQLEDVGRYEQAYNNLIKEVGVLVSRNSLAEDEADRLSRMNAEILSHTNPNQKIFYVDRVRKELAETKQTLISTTWERDAAVKNNAALVSELATYKSVVVPIDGKPKTALTRVQRAPLAASTRQNAPFS